MTQGEQIQHCQRWTGGRESWRDAREVIDPSRYGVTVIASDSVALDFVAAHHYARTLPAARLRVGLERVARGGGVELVGVAVFSVPMSPHVVPAWLPYLEASEGLELGRFVLIDDVPGNGETWFLARAFGLIASELPEVRGVLSFSDPARRYNAAGQLYMPGHVGTIYQAHNGKYCGRSRARWRWFDPDGCEFPDRAVQKIRKGERGWQAATERLEAASGVKRRAGESGESFVARAQASGCLRRLRHPGNLGYVWSLTKRDRRAFGALDALPYVKTREDLQPEDDAPAAHSSEVTP